jgi:hypothetical protein
MDEDDCDGPPAELADAINVGDEVARLLQCARGVHADRCERPGDDNVDVAFADRVGKLLLPVGIGKAQPSPRVFKDEDAVAELAACPTVALALQLAAEERPRPFVFDQ